MKTLLRTITLAALSLGAIACNPDYQTVRLTAESNPPAAVNIRGNRVELPAGIAVVVEAELVSRTNEDYPGRGELELYASDPNIFEVYPRPNHEEFVVVGINPGEACMEVVVDGRQEDCIDVTVTAAPI
jgi:hypothetical protein